LTLVDGEEQAWRLDAVRGGEFHVELTNLGLTLLHVPLPGLRAGQLSGCSERCRSKGNMFVQDFVNGAGIVVGRH
jgi:hypothetical protein